MTLLDEPKLTFDDVAAKFKHWRATRSNSREKIPDSLWGDVIRLVGAYSAFEITRRLGLNHTQLKTKLNEVARAELNKHGLSSPFVEASNLSKIKPTDTQTKPCDAPPTEAEAPATLAQAGPIEIRRADGSVLVIQALPMHSIHLLIQAFIGGE